MLYSYDSLRFQRRPQQVLSTQEYYYMAGHFLTNHTWPNARTRRVWEMHVNGDSMLDISKKLKVNKNWANKLIQDLAASMLGIKDSNGNDKKS